MTHLTNVPADSLTFPHRRRTACCSTCVCVLLRLCFVHLFKDSADCCSRFRMDKVEGVIIKLITGVILFLPEMHEMESSYRQTLFTTEACSCSQGRSRDSFLPRQRKLGLEGPTSDARRAESGVGLLGGAASPPPRQLGGLGSAVS